MRFWGAFAPLCFGLAASACSSAGPADAEPALGIPATTTNPLPDGSVAVSSTLAGTTTAAGSATAGAPATLATTARTSTTTTSQVAPASELATDEPALFPSLEDFLDFYSASSGAVASNAGGEEFSVTVDDFIVDEIDGFDRGFASTEVFDAGIMLGTLNDADEVTSAVLFYDPDGESAADAVSAFLVSMLGSSTSFEFDPLLQAYPDVVARSREGAGEQLWFTNAGDTNHSLVVSVVAGAVDGDNLIEIAVVPIADEDRAKAAVQIARPSLLSLVTND